MNNKRLNQLITQYKDGNLSREEYQEFLTILNESEIDERLDKLLDQYWEETDIPADMGHAKIKTGNPSKSRKRYLYWGAAAVMVLMLGVFFFMKGTPDIFKNPEMVYQTGFGERQEVVLDDGSIITLNANSSLRWSNDWKESRSREVILEGEAFFEVEKQEGIPFSVRTNDVSVEVLGTSFNVDSREEMTEVYLEEGKVNLKLLAEMDKGAKRSDQEIIMKPGDQVRFSAREEKIEKTEGQTMITAAAWKKNVLNFKNMKFSDVLNLLRDIYGQSFECSDRTLLSTPMYLGVPYSDWDAVRQALELSMNIEFEKTASRRYLVKSLKK